MTDTVNSLVGQAYTASHRPGARADVVSRLRNLMKSDPGVVTDIASRIAAMAQVPRQRCVITAARLSVLREAMEGAKNA
jgi:hypothetical protein